MPQRLMISGPLKERGDCLPLAAVSGQSDEINDIALGFVIGVVFECAALREYAKAGVLLRSKW